MIYRQYFAWSNKGLTFERYLREVPEFLEAEYAAFPTHCRYDVIPWTLSGPVISFREEEPLPKKITLMEPGKTSRPYPDNPLPAPQHFLVSGIRVGIEGLCEEDFQWGYWTRRKVDFVIGCKFYQESLLHGNLDLEEGAVEGDVVPIIIYGMEYRLSVEGIAFDAPRDFSICGHLHGYLARGVQ